MKMNTAYSPEHCLRRVEDIVHLSVIGTDGILHLLGRGVDSTGVSASAWIDEADAVIHYVVREFLITETNVGPPAVTNNSGAG